MSNRIERKVVVTLVESDKVTNMRLLAEVIAKKMIERGL